MSEFSKSKVKKIKRLIFLKDVFTIAISAFGGPAMHIALFNKRMVQEKKYLTEEELMELYSLSQMLPGPSSTQTITSMGYKFGGAFLAFLTLIVWILPAFILMTILSFSFFFLEDSSAPDLFRFIGPLVVSFVTVAAIKMTQKIAKTKLAVWLIIMAFVVAALLRHPLEQYVKTPWIFPFVIVLGGLVSFFVNRRYIKHQKDKLNIPWRYVIMWASIFIIAGVLSTVSDNRIFRLFENTYRYGTLVFGGGNVLITMMLEQFVSVNKFLTHEEFMAGYGLKQAVPGPIFTITTFISGLSMREYGTFWQLLGAVVGTIGIFLPGTLMIFFVYPVWDQIKKYSMIQRSLDGVIAASTGLVVTAAYLLFLPVGLHWIEPDSFYYTNLDTANPMNWLNIGIIAVLIPILYKTKIPTPVWVLITLAAGLLLP